MTTAQDMIDEMMFMRKKPLHINPDLNFFNAFGALKTQKNDKLINRFCGFAGSAYDDLNGLQCAFFSNIGYLECAELLFWVEEDEAEELTALLLACYLIKSHELDQLEQAGADALKRLLERNLDEYGSGSFAVKRLLLGLYNGNAYPFDLTSLRNLDSNNFNDIILVLKMNAKSCPRQEIHCYVENGADVWEKMKKDVE